MNKQFIIALACAVGCAISSASAARQLVKINDDWAFYKDTAKQGIDNIEPSSWQTINLPHTWNAEDGQDGGNNYWRGDGWYRKEYLIGKDYAEGKVYLQFDGANLVTDLYVNGQHVGTHKGGYARFRMDITENIKPGRKNTIVVKVNNNTHANKKQVMGIHGDWTKGGGIYRNVYLLATDPIHIDAMDYGASGVYVKQSNVSMKKADVQVTTKVVNESDADREIRVRTLITDRDNKPVLELDTTHLIAANGRHDFIHTGSVDAPHLWDGQKDPYLYHVRSEVYDQDRVADQLDTRIGFRFFHVDVDKGFFLNGKHYRLKGVCKHQDREDKGFAVSREDLEQDIAIMNELGVNAVRLAHYQHAGCVYDLLDEQGYVVWTEIPLIAAIYDNPEFYKNTRQQLKELIRQNFNHPSVCFWGLGNELKKESIEQTHILLPQLNDLAHREDPTRLTTYATFYPFDAKFGNNYASDLLGWNCYYLWYDANDGFGKFADWHHKSRPRRKFGISEYGAGASIHHHQEQLIKPETKSPWHPEEWQSYVHEKTWGYISEREYIWGSFIWNMFDFAADHRAEGDRLGINDKGLVTHDRTVKKDAFYFYKANWSEEPFVHITSRRADNRSQQDVTVKVYSNCDQAELLINGKRQGPKQPIKGICLWEGLSIEDGQNVEVMGRKGSVQATDKIVWNKITP